MSKSIFVVTRGEYSDYGIYGVFDNEADANEFAHVVDGRVETYVLNQMPEHKPGYRFYSVRMDADGNAKAPHLETDFDKKSGVEARSDGRLLIRMWARDKDHAIKIAGDKRRMYLATPPEEAP